MKSWYLLLLLFPSLGSCQENLPCQNLVLEEPVTLPLGQTISSCTEELSLSFLNIISDSRCPSNANCIWEGMVEVQVMVQFQNQKSTFNLSSQPEFGEKIPDSKEAFGFLIQLENVFPYPEVGKTPSEKDKKVVLLVKKAP